MKSTLAFLAMLCAVGMTSASAQTGVFKVKIVLPVLEVQEPENFENPDKIVTHKLANDEIVNLALGRPLDTKVDKETEVLAAAVTFEGEDPNDPNPKSKLVVYDTTKNGEEGVVTVIGDMDLVDFNSAALKSTRSGFGIARGRILATNPELGDPTKNGFVESIVQGAGRCAGKSIYANFNPDDPSESMLNSSPKGVVMIQGHVKFVYTDGQGTHNVDGFVTNGLGKISGKPIGGWEDTPL